MDFFFLLFYWPKPVLEPFLIILNKSCGMFGHNNFFETIKPQPVNVVVLYVFQIKKSKMMLDKKEKRLFL
jgi:hypothetical protein